VENGDDAIAFLLRQGRFADAPTPDLILLDLNIPRKRDPDLKFVPVIVLTSSASQADVRPAYPFGAKSYCRKPCDLDETERLRAERRVCEVCGAMKGRRRCVADSG